MIRLIAIFAVGLILGVAGERYLAKDACLDLGGTMQGGICRGVNV
ncbi:hypothetical protein [Paracoccus sp. (in: a-proteobacteria)]|nr:hypothetical protein [Paracoccus sp. (in: a-proteobacteria)]MDO5646964.1 hypothetical protein [Paracoccus sp. (in: a-proteobacteria)]